MAKNLDIIRSERLILRGITEADAGKIVEWRSNPENYRYFKSPREITLKEHLEWFYTRYLCDENRLDWICIDTATGDRIGVFGLVRDETKTEINYLLAPKAQHKGYASEAVKALIKYAVSQWNTSQIIAEIHQDNFASIALAERLGFTVLSKTENFVCYGTSLKNEKVEDF